jgi:hypothetical protein
LISRRCVSELQAASASGNATPPRSSRLCAMELRNVLPCHLSFRLVFTCLPMLDCGGRRRDPPHGVRIADASSAGIEGRRQPLHGKGRIGPRAGGGVTVARAHGRELYDVEVPFHHPEEVAVADGRRSTGWRRYVGEQ